MRLLKLFGFLLFVLIGLPQNFYSESKIRSYLYADSDKTFGTKIQTPYTEARFSLRYPDTNFGLTFSTKKISSIISLTMKTGNLNGGGGISHLNNPVISSSSSPFSSGITEASLCTASLPGYTSFSKEPSIYFQAFLTPLFNKKINLQLSCLTLPEAASPVTSILVSSTLFKRRLKLQFSSTAGNFFYKENSSSSWFLTDSYYPRGKHFCAINELTLEYSGKIKILTGLTAACYETPFGSLPLNLKAAAKLSSSHMDFYITAFYNPSEGIMTSSQKSIASCLQLKGGLVLKSLMKRDSMSPFFIKTGFNILSTINLMQTEHPLIINGGIQLSSSNNSFSLTGSINLKVLSSLQTMNPYKVELSGISFQIKESHFFKYLDAGAVCSANFTPGKNDTIKSKYKFTLNLNSNTKHKISGSSSFSLNQKDENDYQKKLSAALSLTLNFEYLCISGKLSFSTDL